MLRGLPARRAVGYDSVAQDEYESALDAGGRKGVVGQLLLAGMQQSEGAARGEAYKELLGDCMGTKERLDRSCTDIVGIERKGRLDLGLLPLSLAIQG